MFLRLVVCKSSNPASETLRFDWSVKYFLHRKGMLSAPHVAEGKQD